MIFSHYNKFSGIENGCFLKYLNKSQNKSKITFRCDTSHSIFTETTTHFADLANTRDHNTSAMVSANTGYCLKYIFIQIKSTYIIKNKEKYIFA